MLKHYLFGAFRHLKKQFGYALINISGLAIGFASCILILLFVQDELSFDQYHQNPEEIYRLVIDAEIGGRLDHFAVPPFAAAPTFARELPAIKASARMIEADGQLFYDDQRFEEENTFFVDTAFFDVFTYEFLQGDPATVLDKPGATVFTKDAAERIFGKEDPLGKAFKVDDRDLFVAGIIKEVPRNSHFTFDFVVSMNSIQGDEARFLSMWLNIGAWSYFRLEPGTDPRNLEEQFPAIVETHTGEDAERAGIKFTFLLKKMTDIHLHSHLQGEIEGNSDITYVYTFSAVAIFILLIACINFINISTARASNRAREVGVRKASGATQGNLIAQFMGESLMLAFISLVLAIALAAVMMPFFNQLAEKSFERADLFQPGILLGMAGLLLFSGVLAGSYPAFVLAGYKPVTVLRGRSKSGPGKVGLRKVLVVLQFSISVILIIATLVAVQQVNFLKEKNLGFNKEQVLVVPMRTDVSPERFESIRNEMLQHADILEASFSSVVPGRGSELRLFIPEGSAASETHAMDLGRIDFNFISTYEMEVVQGRNFSPDMRTDSTEAFLINETAARKLGWAEEAVGKEFEFLNARKGKIIGVVKDFHFRSVTEEISPIVFMVAARPGRFLSLKIRPEKASEVISYVKDIWQSFEANRPIEYYFVAEDFADRYESEERTGKIIGVFATLAIFIAALGVLGLAFFTVEQRTKEIGIRKILGASPGRLLYLMAKDFIVLVLLSNAIGWPLAYYLLKTYWLVNFPYAIELSLGVFVMAGAISVLITALAISYQSRKAVFLDPVNSLRYE